MSEKRRKKFIVAVYREQERTVLSDISECGTHNADVYQHLFDVDSRHFNKFYMSGIIIINIGIAGVYNYYSV